MANLYGSNKLANSYADDNLNGWTGVNNVAVVSGGDGSPANCFKVGAAGGMSQSVSVSPQPEDVRITAKFLPGTAPANSAVTAYIKCEMTYADGSKDTYTIPCVGKKVGG